MKYPPLLFNKASAQNRATYFAQKPKAKKALTLVEVLLSIAMLTIVIGVSIPISQSVQNTNNIDIAINTIVQNLRRAQELARSSDSDTTWGVSVQSGSITLFKGSSYALRNSDFDDFFDVASNITPSGVTEIVYSKFYGFPNTTGTLTLTLNDIVRTITINEKGTLTY